MEKSAFVLGMEVMIDVTGPDAVKSWVAYGGFHKG